MTFNNSDYICKFKSHGQKSGKWLENIFFAKYPTRTEATMAEMVVDFQCYAMLCISNCNINEKRWTLALCVYLFRCAISILLFPHHTIIIWYLPFAVREHYTAFPYFSECFCVVPVSLFAKLLHINCKTEMLLNSKRQSTQSTAKAIFKFYICFERGDGTMNGLVFVYANCTTLSQGLVELIGIVEQVMHMRRSNGISKYNAHSVPR